MINLASYAHGCAWNIPLVAKPLYTLLDDSAARFPNRPYLDFLGRQYTYGDIAAQVAKAACGFQALGVGPDVKVGLFLPNCPQYVVAYNAILKAGGTVVNFSPLYSVDELVHQVEDSETDIMICLDVAALYATISTVMTKSRLRCLVVASLADALPRGKALLYRLFKRREQAKVRSDIGHIAFAKLLEPAKDLQVYPVDPKVDIALIQYTGGTTGTPKGAMLTHANMSVNAQQVAAIDSNSNEKDIMLGALPFFHVFANTVVLNATTVMGGMIAMLPKFELAQALKTIERTRVTIMPGVPTMYTALLDHPKINSFDLKSIRVCISGGAPMPVELKERFQNKTGAVVAEGYGLTESSGVVSVNPFMGNNKPGSIGLPLPGTEIVIVDRDDRHKIMGLGEVGELCITGPQVMRGYWKNDAATTDVMTENRLHTGDVGYVDTDGYGFIIDRIKDMITVGGFKVFPRHLEDVLYKHPAVKEAAVIAMPDAYLGQRPLAFVVLQAAATGTITGSNLLAWLKPQIGKHEVPKEIIIRDALPKTMIGKIDKKKLAAETQAC